MDIRLERHRVRENYGAPLDERTSPGLPDIAGVEIEHLVGDDAGDTHYQQEGEKTHPGTESSFYQYQFNTVILPSNLIFIYNV